VSIEFRASPIGLGPVKSLILSRTALQSRIAPLAAVFILIFTSACTVPLAPGYRISKESREIQFVSAETPELKIRGNFTLLNYGTSDLKFIDVVFPVEKTYGLKTLNVQVNGHDATPAALPVELQYSHPNTLRIPLHSVWQQKQKLELLIEYVLSSPDDSGTQITLGPKTFSLGFRGWFVVLQSPDHALSPFPTRPDKTLIAIRVPPNFLLLSRGNGNGKKSTGNEIEYRYQLRVKDLAPFVVAGQYVEPASSRRGANSVVFWTLEPLKEDPAASAERIAAAWDTLQKIFGSLDKNARAPYIVESPGLRNHTTGEAGPAAASFPGGALVNPAALAMGINSDEFLDKVTHALARNWFGEQIYPPPFAQIGLGEGLPEYATIVIDEARKGEAARRQRVVQLLHEYDVASAKAVEMPLGVTKMSDAPEQRAISLAKAPLLFIALEDQCGEEPVRKALARVVSLLQGQQVGYNEIRSAIEESSGKDLAAFFRVWLYEKGMPKDFRSRYEPANESQP
jgi:Peptidase family M1 domain